MNNTLTKPTLESVATEFELWRKVKICNFSKTPPHLVRLVQQLQHHYKKSHIIKALKLNGINFKKITTASQFVPQTKNSNIEFVELPSICPALTEQKVNLPNCLLQRVDGTQYNGPHILDSKNRKLRYNVLQ